MRVILILAAVMTLLVYLGSFRSTLYDRMIVLAFFALELIAICMPELTTSVAQTLGIGRGADLIFYVFISGSVFVTVVLYSRLLLLQRALTDIVRHLAVQNPTPPQLSEKAYKFQHTKARTATRPKDPIEAGTYTCRRCCGERRGRLVAPPRVEGARYGTL